MLLWAIAFGLIVWLLAVLFFWGLLHAHRINQFRGRSA